MDEFIKEKGIVLYSVDYNDYDKLLTIYLFNYGKMLVNIKSFKRSNKFSSVSINMCFGEFTINKKKNNKLISFDLIEAFMKSNYDIKKYYAKASVVEVFTKITKEKVNKDELAIMLLNFLKFIEYKDDTEEKFVAYILLKFIQKEGYIADFKLDPYTNKPFIEGAEFAENDKGLKNICKHSEKDDIISIKGLKQLQYIYNMKEESLLDEIKSINVEKNIIKWLFKFIEYKFEINLNAYKEYLKL